jgi:hypothetical protein
VRQRFVDNDLLPGSDDDPPMSARIVVVGERDRLHLVQQRVWHPLVRQLLAKAPPPQGYLPRP